MGFSLTVTVFAIAWSLFVIGYLIMMLNEYMDSTAIYFGLTVVFAASGAMMLVGGALAWFFILLYLFQLVI